MLPPSTTPSPASDGSSRGDPGQEHARNRRLVILVEAFLRQVRRGGSLDPEPFLASAEELRAELEPLLLGVLRLERISEGFDTARRTPRVEGGGEDGAG